MLYLIVLLVSLFVGFAGAAHLFRRHLRSCLLQSEQRKEALRKIMYDAHHHGTNPKCKRIRGITVLGTIVSQRLPESPEKEELILFFHIINEETSSLETDTMNKVKEFEHLQ